MENNEKDSFLQMHLDYDGGHILYETVRWSRFLSIVGFVFLLLIVLIFALAGSDLLAQFSRMAPGGERLGGAIVIAAVLIVLVIVGFAVFMLYRFSRFTRRGIERQDQATFAEGMRCLKLYFVSSGILAALVLLNNISSIIKLFNS